MTRISNIVILFISLYLFMPYTILQAESPQRIHIGIIIPLSGPLAEYGIATRKGIEMAIEDTPELSQLVKFSYEDSRYDSKTAVNAFHSLRIRKKVDIIYNFGGPTSEALAPLAKKYKIPLLCWSSDQSISINNPYLIRFINPSKDFIKPIIEKLHHKSVRKIGIIKTDNQYLETLVSALILETSEKLSIEVIDSYSTKELDFRSTVAKLKQKNFDAIGVFLLPGQIAQFYEELRIQKTDFLTFGSDFFESKTEIKKSGLAIEGAYFANHVVRDDFLKRYISSYGNDLQISNAGLGYDLAHLILHVAKSSHSKPLLTTLSETTTWKGVSGSVSYHHTEDNDKYFSFPIKLRVIKDGSPQDDNAL